MQPEQKGTAEREAQAAFVRALTERDRLNHEAALDLASRIRSYCEPPRLASEGAAVIEALSREVGRLRGVVRVNALRQGATHAEVDAVIYPEDGKQ